MLTTGTPVGTGVSQENTFLEGSPYLFFQDYRANPLNNPDSAGYYWGLSGTATYNYKAIGCVQNVSLTEGVTMNDVRCDAVGVKDTIQKRNYVEFNVEIISLLPLSVLAPMLNLSPATVSTGIESVGIPQIDNTLHYMVYAPKVYSETDGYWLTFHLHRCKFVDAWTINMKYGEPWNATGLKIRAFADDTKPANQMFGVLKRFDKGALP